jgi:diguanylate cyclase (GGDEF)-like protein
MRSLSANTSLNWLKRLLLGHGDAEIEDDLLRHLVESIYAAPVMLIASSAMAMGIAAVAWAMTGDPIFLGFCIGQLVIGAGRIACARGYRERFGPGDRREKTLAFDSAYSFWSTLQALLLGWTYYMLAAQPEAMETLPLAGGTCAGFTIAYAIRSSGRPRMLLWQVAALLLPVIQGLLTLPIANGRYYAIVVAGLAVTSVVLGRSANARIVELYRVHDGDRRAARLDTLTGIMNRFSFADALAAALTAGADAPDQRFAVVTIDLDRFKEINDTLGHLVGDEVIKQTAERLAAVAGPSDCVARLGGDEFVILARGREMDSRGVADYASRVVAALCRPHELETLSLPASASVGVSIYPDHGASAPELMKHADIALYESKRSGRGRYRIFDQPMRSRLADARVLEKEMREAIARDQFEAWFQPIQNIDNGTIVGYEALARWRHPTLGLIAPDRFIPVAEQNGAIVEIGQAILGKACRAAAQWDTRLTVAVNLSPGQFRRPQLLVEAIRDTLARTRLVPSRLFIEITESLLLEDTPRTRAAINELSELGVHFTLDDFGAGYSSLSYIQDYPFSRIKIDKKFVHQIDQDNVSSAIIASVGVLAERIHVEIVAEGVETRAQQAALRGLGVHFAQGYLYGRPSPRIAGAAAAQLVASR